MNAFTNSILACKKKSLRPNCFCNSFISYSSLDQHEIIPRIAPTNPMLRIKLRLPTLFVLAIAFVSFVSIYHYMKFTTRYYYLQGQELAQYNSLGYDVLSSRMYLDELRPPTYPVANQNLTKRIQRFRAFLSQRFNYTTEETTADRYPNTTTVVEDGANIRKGGDKKEQGKERAGTVQMEPIHKKHNLQGVNHAKNLASHAWSGDENGPYRRPEEMENDRLCLKEGQGYAHFMHMRKAGGSSVRDYLNLLISRNVSKYLYHFYVTEGDTFNVSCFKDQGSMVLVTNLRYAQVHTYMYLSISYIEKKGEVL